MESVKIKIGFSLNENESEKTFRKDNSICCWFQEIMHFVVDIQNPESRLLKP